MTNFWILATLLTSVALGFLIYPLMRLRKTSGEWSLSGLGVAAIIIPVAFGLYVSTSNWGGSEVTSGPDVDSSLPPVADMVASLSERLKNNSEDINGWRLLGQSYMALGNYSEAAVAFREVWSRTLVADDALKLALAEAEALTDQNSLRGEAGKLFEEVLVTQPMNPRALWYGGLAALATERDDVARERWSDLLTLDPPQQVVQVIRQEFGDIGKVMPGSGESNSALGSSIILNVSVSEALLTDNLGPQSALFIFARAPEGGPPLAVIRQPATAVPGKFFLSDQDAMIPGRSLADFEVLSLVARLSLNGQPVEQVGDLYGVLQYRPGQSSAAVNLLIDQIVD
ncbi:MAG: hypothetical protein AAEI08_03125 [Gammaproteobacteria bacterium]